MKKPDLGDNIFYSLDDKELAYKTIMSNIDVDMMTCSVSQDKMIYNNIYKLVKRLIDKGFFYTNNTNFLFERNYISTSSIVGRLLVLEQKMIDSRTNTIFYSLVYNNRFQLKCAYLDISINTLSDYIIYQRIAKRKRIAKMYSTKTKSK